MTLNAYVISSRVRLARNLRAYRLPPAASAEERQAVCACIGRIVRTEPRFQGAEMVMIDDLTPLERKVLEEQQVISHQFASQGSSRMLVLQNAAHVSMLINEEDHLRVQSITPGFHLYAAWQRVQHVEKCLGSHLNFAASGSGGYVTACPSNAGLGMRVSVLMFLPGLIMLRRIKPLMHTWLSAGYTLRGMYGEGSASHGYLLQMSRQRPEERSAVRLVEEMQAMCRHIMLQEKRARTCLMGKSANIFRQEFEQARARLSTAHTLDVAAAMQIIGVYRLGLAFGRLPVAPSLRRTLCQRLDRLWMQIQPAHIRQDALRRREAASGPGDAARADEPECIRAALLRQYLFHELWEGTTLCLHDLPNAHEK